MVRRSLLVLILVAILGLPHATASVESPVETVSRLVDEHVTNERPCVDASDPKRPEVDVRPHGCEPRRFLMDVMYAAACEASNSCDPRVARMMEVLERWVGPHVDEVLKIAHDLLYKECMPACFEHKNPEPSDLLP